MASIDRYRPPREGYQPPSLPPKPERPSRSPSKRRDVPPSVPSPPTLSSRTSPPRPTSARKSAPSPIQRSPAAAPRPRANQWFFTSDEVASTPSIAEGLPPAEERLRRAKGVNFIYQAGVLLDLPQITLWVAGVFFHRFYMRRSMIEEKGGIHHYNIAATALFLANKTEENCRKTKEVIINVAKVAQKNAKLIIDEQSKEYWRWRDSILMYEELMLEILTFDLMVDNPYQRLYEHLGLLDIVHNKRLREAAWAFCNDACLTVLPLMMEARDVSIAAIFFATSSTQEKIDDVNGEPWWKVLRGDEGRVIKAINVMTEFYSENPLRKQDSRYQGSPEFNLESTRRRGETILSQTEVGSSQNGTPMDIDRGTQSPRARINGNSQDKAQPAKEGEDSSQDVTSASETQRARGDSDVNSKTAANDIDDRGPKPNGNGVRSPGSKRKAPELNSELESERQEKRARLSPEDEGEVLE
ncbi:Cyclin pch1 [Pleurostoma richardsiae]|uniref:RNA polymerase II holoenzyme cyclin-like subunit n=1 Tax=Pleurostoma richardsiae TaxID=41990 RepID=A0AA38W0N0_9PEZI|nr:Cyclin pch1 [Pleurostoma richardsiae]